MAFLDSISNNITSIAVFILCLIILYLFFTAVTKADGITQLQDANVPSVITFTDMGIIEDEKESTNCAYSVWIYISDWSYGYGANKPIFERDNGSLKVYLDKHDSNLVVSRKSCPSGTSGSSASDGTISTSDSSSGSGNIGADSAAAQAVADAAQEEADKYVTSPFTLLNDTYKEGMETCSTGEDFNCVVSNIPLQKWVNVIVSLDSKILDIYINGKLVKTCVTGEPKIYSGDNGVKLTDNGGFSGYTSKFRYFPNSMNPQTAWNTYQQGWSETNIFGLNAAYDVDLIVTKNGKKIF